MNALAARSKSQTQFLMKSIAFEDIDKQQKPFMSVIYLSSGIAHWIVVLDTDGTSIKVADPLCGVVNRKYEDYQDIWYERCIIATIKNVK